MMPPEASNEGDSLKNDIRPAHLLGCQTVWLKGESWDSEAAEEIPQHPAEADRVITDITELIND